MESDIAQVEPLSIDQVRNSEGAFIWQVDDMERLRRFLCLGSEKGTYYVKERQLTLENAKCISSMIKDGKGQDVVKEIVKYSVEGRTAKQNPIIFSLAMCARQGGDINTKRAAYQALSRVCRIPTHLFTFVDYCEVLSKGQVKRGTGWGRAQRRAVCEWYNKFDKEPKRLAQHVTKYRSRNGWTHKDVLRLAHPKPVSHRVGAVIRYVVKGLEMAKKDYLNEDTDKRVKKIFVFLEAVEQARTSTDQQTVMHLIERHGLVREHIPTNMLKSQHIWIALLQKMPMTAMIRNLGKMTSVGILCEQAAEVHIVLAKLTNDEALKEAMIHPFNVLVALKTYEQGKGDKGKLIWTPNRQILKGLETAFYKSFKYVEKTHQRYCLALDVSGSMCSSIMGCKMVQAREAAAALSMVTARTESNYEIMAFSHKLKKLNISPKMDLTTVLSVTNGLSFEGTDCALPMIWAKDNNKLIDVFIVYTDSETLYGTVHPAEALRHYRKASGIWQAKLIVCGLTSNGFTIADPNDPGMLDMVGFDSAGPEIIRNFSLGFL